MAEIINMPRLSDTMEEGTVAKWLKKVGDKVEEGDILAEIETDKATMEFESFHQGTLLHIGVQEGETTKVDELLAIIGEEGEDISDLISNSKTQASNSKEDKTSDRSKEDEKSKDDKVAQSEDEASHNDSNNTTELPEGVTVVTMPRLSDTMEEGTVATWLKKVGDQVSEGDILAEIETDKATMEFESFQAGTLLHVGLEEGESAKVDALLAIIGPEGTDVSAIAKNFKAEGASTKSETTGADTASKTKENAPQEAPKQTSATSGSGSSSSSTSSSDSSRIFISPLAKKMADEKGINIQQIKGSGENGRIIKRDIENFKPSETISVGKFVPTGQEDFDEVNHSQMRKVIAKRLAESKFTAPHYYLNVEFDMEHAIAFREQYNSLPDTKISYNDMIVKACALALKRHPQVNSQWFDDRMQLNNHVHIGVAVAVPDGLVVPVVKFANEQSLTHIGVAVKDFAVKASNERLTPQEMEGSTFTISNLGMFGIESFTSIINQPNTAILCVGAIKEKHVVKIG